MRPIGYCSDCARLEEQVKALEKKLKEQEKALCGYKRTLHSERAATYYAKVKRRWVRWEA